MWEAERTAQPQLISLISAGLVTASRTQRARSVSLFEGHPQPFAHADDALGQRSSATSLAASGQKLDG